MSIGNKSLKMANLPQAEYKGSTRIMLASLDLGFRQQCQFLTLAFSTKKTFFETELLETKETVINAEL